MGKRNVWIGARAVALVGGLLLPVIGWSGPPPAVLEYRQHMFDPPVRTLANRTSELMFDTVRVEPGSSTWKLQAKPAALDFTYAFEGKVHQASDALENT